MTPRLAKLLVHRRIRNHCWHHSIAGHVELIGRPAAEHRGQILAQVARVRVLRVPVKAVHHQHYVDEQDFLIGPVVVDGRFAYPGTLRDRVHAGGINAALSKKLERGVKHSFMRLLTARPRHH